MRERTNDGGPAYPRIDGIEEGDFGRQLVISTDGMSLRAWLAGKALTGMLAGFGEAPPPFKDVAVEAVEYADAVLDALAA